MKRIEGFSNYGVTSCGRIWSYYTKRWLKPTIDKDGYLKVGLYKDGEQVWFQVQRLVALAYIPNPDNLPEVNFIDEDKTHVYIGNLEWCDHTYNMNWATCPERITASNYGKSHGKKAKKVYCPELDEEFASQGEAARKYGISQENISQCCRGISKHAGKHPVTGQRLTWVFV